MKNEQKKRYNEVIKLVGRICEAKNWDYYINEVSNKYATFSVSQDINGSEVTADIHITVDSSVKISSEKTSFFGYGIKSLLDVITNELGSLSWLESPKKITKSEPASSLTQLLNLLDRFHLVAHQIKRRHSNRPTLIIDDEYDVQDLLHSLLKINFQDIRPEEYTPSYAGASSRVDFLLKAEQIVVEVKFATDKLNDRRIGEQLIIDIKKYRSHPNCKTLVCFVYDPGGHLKNPHGLENDLSEKSSEMNVVVIVNPIV